MKSFIHKFRAFILLVLCVLNFSVGRAQDSTSLRISIITCGAGSDLYSVYGHSAIRVLDNMTGSDVVYNYGTFNFGDPDFYSKFTRGKLLYYVNDESFLGFMNIYQQEGRSVYEQVLNLKPEDAILVNNFLINNLKEENKYYRYDFLFDNCSTRIRDLFSTTFGKRFEYGYVVKDDSVSFRTFLDYYERNVHWERFGINLLLSNKVDDKMNNAQSMFLPDYLMKGFRGATLDGQLVVKETIQLLPEPNFPIDLPNTPKHLFWILFALIVILSFSPKMKTPLLFFDVLFFLVLGLLGCFMLFMWFGTEHVVCAYNRNIFWAFPLHIVFAFLIPRQSAKAAQYARYASWLVVASLFYNLFAEQKYMDEIIPLILLIIFRLNRYSTQLKINTFKQFIR